MMTPLEQKLRRKFTRKKTKKKGQIERCSRFRSVIREISFNITYINQTK